jgi:hypothetical protein
LAKNAFIALLEPEGFEQLAKMNKESELHAINVFC